MSNRSSMYRDARWQKRRLEILERDKYQCLCCGYDGQNPSEETPKMLNIHHAYYITGNSPWEYPDDMLATYCEDCHKSHHEFINTIQKGLLFQPYHVTMGLMNAIHRNMFHSLMALFDHCDDYLLAEFIKLQANINEGYDITEDVARRNRQRWELYKEKFLTFHKGKFNPLNIPESEI